MNPIKLIFQHPDFWVVVKPSGESFHSEDGEGFFARLSAQFPEQVFYPLHRLDKLTSGILVFATNKQAAAEFGMLFEQHKFEKRYLAVSAAKPNKKQGTVAGGMVPSRRGQWRLTKQLDNFAATQFFSFAESGKRYFWLRPLTGKTHQIRVALKSIGSPILGDERYGGVAADRGYLHAVKIAFEWRGEAFDFVSWPDTGEFFTESSRTQYQDLFLMGQEIWPKFTIPKKSI